mmetsp:Transcript_5590/g.11054  ORF Transcript_5590/g.11054 Transcript_5590/m.11054 type:complete len:484 (+) Transcript_5590:768-2219(+)
MVPSGSLVDELDPHGLALSRCVGLVVSFVPFRVDLILFRHGLVFISVLDLVFVVAIVVSVVRHVVLAFGENGRFLGPGLDDPSLAATRGGVGTVIVSLIAIIVLAHIHILVLTIVVLLLLMMTVSPHVTFIMGEFVAKVSVGAFVDVLILVAVAMLGFGSSTIVLRILSMGKAVFLLIEVRVLLLLDLARNDKLALALLGSEVVLGMKDTTQCLPELTAVDDHVEEACEVADAIEGLLIGSEHQRHGDEVQDDERRREGHVLDLEEHRHVCRGVVASVLRDDRDVRERHRDEPDEDGHGRAGHEVPDPAHVQGLVASEEEEDEEEKAGNDHPLHAPANEETRRGQRVVRSRDDHQAGVGHQARGQGRLDAVGNSPGCRGLRLSGSRLRENLLLVRRALENLTGHQSLGHVLLAGQGSNVHHRPGSEGALERGYSGQVLGHRAVDVPAVIFLVLRGRELLRPLRLFHVHRMAGPGGRSIPLDRP